MMPTNTPPTIDYTARDYPTAVAAIQQYITGLGPNTWNSFFQGELGTWLIQALGYAVGSLSFTLDMQYPEGFPDVLQKLESLLHFFSLSGMQFQGATPAVIQAYCEAITPVLRTTTIPAGSQIRSSNGLIWETAQNYTINPGDYGPRIPIVNYGDISGTSYATDGTPTQAKAFVRFVQGSQQVILCDINGNRYSSQFGFPSIVQQGQFLVLTGQIIDGIVGPAPDPTRQDFVVLGVGQEANDPFPNSILFLDRPWDLADYIGQWEIESRSLALKEGETMTESFTAPSDTTRSGYQLPLSYYPVIYLASEDTSPTAVYDTLNSGVTVLVNGIQWDEVRSLQFFAPTSLVYTCKVGNNNAITLTFGDGEMGALLPAGATITVTYRVGGGTAGNLSINSFNGQVTGSDLSNNTVSFQITNPWTSGTGGTSTMSIEQGKALIIQWMRTMSRAVTNVDYDYLASNFKDLVNGSVAMAKSVTNKVAGPVEKNLVWMYTWVNGPNNQLAPPTFALKRSLHDFLTAAAMESDEIIVVDGPNSPTPVYVRYQYRNTDATTALNEVISGLNAKFGTQRPGQDLQLGPLYDNVDTQSNIVKATLVLPDSTIPAVNGFSLYTNSLVPGSTTSLTSIPFPGSSSITVANPSLFAVGGIVCIMDLYKAPMYAVVENITGSLITFQAQYAIQEWYDIGTAIVLNSDILPLGWKTEKAVDIFVRYASSTGNPDGLNRAMQRKIRDWFNFVLFPETAVQASTILALVTTIPNITSANVTLEFADNTNDSTSPAPEELITIRTLFLNGAAY